MNLKWLLVFLFMISANAQSNQFPIQIIEKFDDANIVAYIYENDVNDSIPWNPLKDAPPLSIASAIEAIKEHYITSNKPSSLAITEIEVRPIPRHEDHWHYLIKLKSVVDGKPKNIFYVVLMNGKTIPAIAEPKSFK